MVQTSTSKLLAVLLLCVISTLSASDPYVRNDDDDNAHLSREILEMQIEMEKYEFYNYEKIATDSDGTESYAYFYKNKETHHIEVAIVSPVNGEFKIIQSTIPIIPITPPTYDDKWRRLAPIDDQLRNRYQLQNLDINLDKTKYLEDREMIKMLEIVYEGPTQRQTFVVIQQQGRDIEVVGHFTDELQIQTPSTISVDQGAYDIIDAEIYPQLIQMLDQFFHQRFTQDLEGFKLNRNMIGKRGDNEYIFYYQKGNEEQIYFFMTKTTGRKVWIQERIKDGKASTPEDNLNRDYN